MKKYLFLLLVPGLSYGFQSELSGTRVTYEYGNELYATAYAGNLKYYFSELKYNDIPFKETAFLTATSSVDFFFAKINFDTDSGIFANFDINTMMNGISAVIYYQGLALDISYTNLETTSDSITFENNSSTYSIEPGFRFNDTNMLYAVYRNQIQNDFFDEETTKTYGLGYKSVAEKTNIVFEYSQSEDTPFNNKSDYTAILVEYYLTSLDYVGFRYTVESDDVTNDELSTATISVGGLVEKQLNYQFEYSESTPDIGEKETSFLVAVGINF